MPVPSSALCLVIVFLFQGIVFALFLSKRLFVIFVIFSCFYQSFFFPSFFPASYTQIFLGPALRSRWEGLICCYHRVEGEKKITLPWGFPIKTITLISLYLQRSKKKRNGNALFWGILGEKLQAEGKVQYIKTQGGSVKQQRLKLYMGFFDGDNKGSTSSFTINC